MSLLSELWWGYLCCGWVVVWYMCVWHSCAGNQICLRNACVTLTLLKWQIVQQLLESFLYFFLRATFLCWILCSERLSQTMHAHFYWVLKAGMKRRSCWQRTHTPSSPQCVSTDTAVWFNEKHCSVHVRISTLIFIWLHEQCQQHVHLKKNISESWSQSQTAIKILPNILVIVQTLTLVTS